MLQFKNENFALEGNLPKNTTKRILSFTESAGAVNSAVVTVEYANRWVAAYNGKLVHIADDEATIHKFLKRQNIPSALTAIRFVQP